MRVTERPGRGATHEDFNRDDSSLHLPAQVPLIPTLSPGGARG